MKRTIIFVLAIAVPALLLATLFRSLPARASGVVGDGTAQSCTLDALQEAMQGGGLVTFNCGPGDHTIVVTYTSGLSPTMETTIDGGGRITLSGNGASRMLDVASGVRVTLTNMALRDGYSSIQPGGAIGNRGALALDNVLIADSRVQTPTLSGGAIYNAGGGSLRIRHSALQGNSASGGGAILNALGSHIIVEHSQITGNWVDGVHGAGIANAGFLTMTQSILRDNRVLQESVTPAREGGGAISNLFTGRVWLSWVTVSNNTSDADCGAILNRGWLSIDYGSLSQNSAAQGDGGALCNVKTQPYDVPIANLNGVTVDGNVAINGGAIINDEGTLSVVASTLNENSATMNGGGLWNQSGTVDMLNVTISSNDADANGGGAWNDRGVLDMTHVTQSGNGASQGGGIYSVNAVGTETRLVNSIVAGSGNGGNCAGLALASSSSSLSSDDTCALSGTGDQNNTDPLLGALGNYWGPTQVHMLGDGSPALNAVVNGGAAATDQRGFSRPQLGADDIGAVERNPLDSGFPVAGYLPLVAR